MLMNHQHCPRLLLLGLLYYDKRTGVVLIIFMIIYWITIKSSIRTKIVEGNSFFDNFGEFGDAVQALGSFVGNFIGDTFVTLITEPHGNDGGIRIIPEKFHVHYDAGNKYYAYKLILKASDFVIGV